jgi:hypothetical protein
MNRNEQNRRPNHVEMALRTSPGVGLTDRDIYHSVRYGKRKCGRVFGVC